MNSSASFASVKENIAYLLNTAFKPAILDVVDESYKHHGHAGARPEGETHFHVTIGAEALDGLSRVARERAVHTVLADLLRERVHALSVKVVKSEAGTGVM